MRDALGFRIGRKEVVHDEGEVKKEREMCHMCGRKGVVRAHFGK
jgi:hypothetical protein